MRPSRLWLSVCLSIGVCAGALDVPAARAAEFEASPDDGLILRFPERETVFRLGGRLHFDGAVFAPDVTPTENDFEVRRARPYLEARFGEDWRAKVEYELTSADTSAGNGFRNVWLGYDGIRRTHLRLGNQNVPFGLEESASSNDLVFAERALPSGLGPSFGSGISARSRGRLVARARWLVSGAFYVEPFGTTTLDRHRSDHFGYAGRAVLAPYVRRRRVVHFGASVDYRDVQGGSWSIRRRPESELAPTLLRTTLSSVDSVLAFGVEAALLFGPLLVQGEYLQSQIERTAGSTLGAPTFSGGYAQASFVLTGERHRYSKSTATFRGLRPRHRLGALEVAARWSSLDLDDAGVSGGRAHDATLGLNWYLRENLRLMFNYIHVEANLPGTGIADDPEIFHFRAMVFF